MKRPHICFNRTIVELKFFFLFHCSLSFKSFNRTIVELKYKTAKHRGEECGRFNRTIVELKWPISRYLDDGTTVLIELL